MPNFKPTHFTIKFLVVLATLLQFFGCATIQAPQGGPRDTKPPKVLSMTPKDQTRNFNAKKIVIEFDEYFNIKDEFKEFSISPEQEKLPILKKKKKKLEVQLQDTLEKNTTYTLNFGKAIADVNESNVIKNLSYVFSTGPEIDSLSISGKITNALTLENEKDATVMIFPLEKDSLFGKKRPFIYAVSDSSGLYKLHNLRQGKYKIYAIKEAGGGDKIYQQLSDELGYRKDTITVNKNLENINLKLFKETAAEFRILNTKLNSDGSLSLYFNQQLKQPKIDIIQPPKVNEGKFVKFNKTNDTAKVWLTDLSFDSIKVAVADGDKILKTTNITRFKKDNYNRDVLITDNAVSGKISPYTRYTLTFPFPITAADANKIILLEDSVKRTNFQLIKDSVDFLKYYITYPWKNKRTYDLKFNPGAFTAIFNAKNKEATKRFTLESADNFGTMALKVEVPDTTKNYILEFIDEKKNPVKSYFINKSETISFAKYPTGKYFVRVIYDENKNNKWDTGNLKAGTQPEKIWYSDTDMSLKANWDRELSLTIPPPPTD